MSHKTVALLSMALSLAACGGGGGGSDPPPPVAPAPPPIVVAPPPPPPPPSPVPPPAPPPPAVPELPPAIPVPQPPVAPPVASAPLVLVSFDPVDGTSGVPRTTKVSATFGSDLAASSLTPANVALLAPNGVALPAALTAMGSQLQLTPLSALPGDTTYTMRLGTGLADGAGRTLAAPASAGFTTAAQAWGAAPVKLDTMAKELYGRILPAAVADRAGNVTATWRRSLLGSGIYTARLDAATGSWSNTSLLYESADQAVREGPLLAAPNGDLYQYWLEGKYVQPNLEQARLRYMRFDKASGTWTAPATAAILAAGHDIGRLEMAIDPAGRVTALFTNTSLAGEPGVYASRLERPDGAWTAPARLNSQGAGSISVFYMSLAADGAGNVFAAWNEYAPSSGLFAARYDAAEGRWSAPRQLSGAGGFGGYPGSLSVNSAGVAAVAWGESASDGGGAKFARFDPATRTWSAAFRLDTASDGASNPMVVVDGAGSIVATWMQTLSTVFARRFDALTAQWSAPRQVAADAYSSVTERRMAVDVAGNVTMVVVENKKMKALRYRSRDQAWSVAAPIDTEFGSEKVLYEPVLVMDGSGVATAVWFVRNEPSAFFYQNEVLVNRFK